MLMKQLSISQLCKIHGKWWTRKWLL